MWSTLIEDIAHAAGDVFDNLFGSGAKLPSGEGVIAFTRTPTRSASTSNASSGLPPASEKTQRADDAERDGESSGSGETGEANDAGAAGNFSEKSVSAQES